MATGSLRVLRVGAVMGAAMITFGTFFAVLPDTVAARVGGGLAGGIAFAATLGYASREYRRGSVGERRQLLRLGLAAVGLGLLAYAALLFSVLGPEAYLVLLWFAILALPLWAGNRLLRTYRDQSREGERRAGP